MIEYPLPEGVEIGSPAAELIEAQTAIIVRLLGAWTPLPEQGRWRHYRKDPQPGPTGTNHVDVEETEPMTPAEHGVLTTIRSLR